ncbi:TonB-dependent receptor plug domain-containing protein [Alteromonas lipolytica]|uniref:TonB-dependent receptor n=1 Tax=Alteromonas lipolytica TaxID=1856405 RepID=A0A1E8FC66_9ALTE|nr:TonB-dependent receptor [Alteromonas lipolytica]OFI33489.1 hypothetical protein BFC17_04305 [Alteromonas lipolytica]GGF59247.1 TonB-dependent receptor [Alteromonas lipolytica]
MKIKRISLYSSLVALIGTLATPLYAVAQQQSNDPQPTKEPEPEVITVTSTGTSIRGAAPVGSSLIDLDREFIESSGSVNTIDVLRETPQIFGFGVSDASRSGNGGATNITYSNAINIRGIGPYATLTIMNGRRVVSTDTAGAAFDPSMIPSIALERLEVVADGASAVYGSDAVAGVANLILRRGFEGAQVEAQYGSGDNYSEYQIGAIAGKTWDSGQVTVAMQNSFRSNLFGGDRDFYRADLTSLGGEDYRINNCAPGNIFVGGNSYAIPSGGATPDNLEAGTMNLCDNMSNSTDLLPEREFSSAVVTLNQDVTDNVAFFADMLIATREGKRYSQPYNALLLVPETNAYFVAPQDVTLDPCPASAGVGPNVGCVNVGYTFPGFSGNSTKNTFESDVWQVTGGFDIWLPNDWLLSTYYTIGHSEDSSLNERNNPVAGNLTAALASSDPTTALNPFGTSANSTELLENIFDLYTDTPGKTDIQDFGLKVDGTLFSTDSGDIKMAAGINYYAMDLYTGQGRGPIENIPYRMNDLSRDVKSAYMEFYIPLIGEANSMTGIQSLVLNLAGRIDDYSDVGRTENPKIGLDWIVNDNLAIHASYGESFRAPLLTQLISAAGASLFVQPYFDPTVGTTIRGVTRTGDNLNLVPETAETFSLGIDYSFDFLRGARMSINYFDVTYEGQINRQLSNLNLLRDEAMFQSLILRGEEARAEVAALLDEGLGVRRGSEDEARNTTVLVDGRNLNLGVTEASGIDFTFVAPFKTDHGYYKASLMGTWYDSFKVAQTPDAELVERVNDLNYPMSLRMRASLNWQRDNWSVTGFANYINSYTNTFTGDTIDTFTTFEFSASYTFEDGLGEMGRDLRVGLFVRNLLDEEPPFADIAPSDNGGGGFDPQVASPIGRVITLSLSKTF